MKKHLKNSAFLSISVIISITSLSGYFMANQAQYIERIKNLEQTNQVLVESNHYYKRFKALPFWQAI